MEHTKAGPHEVSVTIDGVRYEGSYVVSEGMVTVTCPWGNDSGRVAPAALAEAAARIMLHDIVRSRMARRQNA